MQRGKGRYPVADYRLAAEINLAELPPDQGPPVWDTPDAWYTPLLPPGGANAAGAAGCRGVYSFCMCPGGQIVPTSTSEQELCINGMSFSKRNSVWANSALVVTVAPADWEHLLPEHGPLAGMALQQLVERCAGGRVGVCAGLGVGDRGGGSPGRWHGGSRAGSCAAFFLMMQFTAQMLGALP